MTAADPVIDPQLQDLVPNFDAERLNRPNSEIRTFENVDEDNSDEEDNGSEKRRKLNVWKCKQCRDARKKCFPEDRVWPQKCTRCLQHRPLPLECSEPELNTRKRGKKKPTSSRLTPDVADSRHIVKDKDGDETLTDAPLVYDRPGPLPILPRGVKRDLPGSPKHVTDTRQPTAVPDDFPKIAYPPLRDGEFRLLLLAPATALEDPVVFSFITVPRLQELEYEAVSYYWGGKDVHHELRTVELRDAQGKRYIRSTRRSVCAALQNLRHNKDHRRFWLDALCVNRDDIREKNQLTAMKRYIFAKATNVCLWIGDDTTSRTALAFVESILDLTGVVNLVRDNDNVGKWVDFVALLKNPLFSRLWIVQEVAVARKTTLHCGQSAKYYGDLVEAVSIFVSLRAEVTRLFRHNNKNCKVLTDRKMTIAERFMDITTNALRTSSDGKVQRLHSLESLISLLSDLSAGDPMDRIYAVLDLAKDGPKLKDGTLTEIPSNIQDQEALHINYGNTVLDVYQEFVTHAIKQSGSLDIICRHWASSLSEKDAKLPTWVRPLNSDLQYPVGDSAERTAADSLVGLPDRAYYHASRSKGPEYRIERHPDINLKLKNAKMLVAHGIRLDTILRIGPRASEGIILYEWLELGGCTQEKDVPQNFWRTLVADRGPNGVNAPPWYRRAFLYCLQHLTPTRDINTNRLIDESEADSSLVVDFLQRVQSVIWNRKFLISEKHKWMGLAPSAAKWDDVICILYGCSVPVVLRPLQSDGSYYELIGECYVHGIMDGEATEMQGLPEEWFHII